MYEEINEPIDVIALFTEHGQLRPYRFRWKSGAFRISKVISTWKVAEVPHLKVHFSVKAQSPDYFELVFDTEKLTWELARISLPG
jgi:hypothetical protein